MLRDVYLPQVWNGSAANPNNIDLAMLEASQFIAVFPDETVLYETVLNRTKQHIRSYNYLSSDGALPMTPAWLTYTTASRVKLLWQNDASFFDGLTQEICRDLDHASYERASISHIIGHRILYKAKICTPANTARDYSTHWKYMGRTLGVGVYQLRSAKRRWSTSCFLLQRLGIVRW
jgi:hypothetical protein